LASCPVAIATAKPGEQLLKVVRYGVMKTLGKIAVVIEDRAGVQEQTRVAVNIDVEKVEPG
tara:strand:- start:666 stop:848 length:183 start_codon:yes stop_codon:yes gene_type:complete